MADRGSAPRQPDARHSGVQDAARLALVVGALGVVFGDIGRVQIL